MVNQSRNMHDNLETEFRNLDSDPEMKPIILVHTHRNKAVLGRIYLRSRLILRHA